MESLHHYCKLLPKVELHAHLNGSIRESTIIDLAKERNVSLPSKLLQHEAEHHDPNKEALFFNTKPRSLEECFEIFTHIPKCVNDIVALKRITEEVLRDFAEDNVAYVELRTGPKVLMYDHRSSDLGSCSKKEYVETIVAIMATFEKVDGERYEQELRHNDVENEHIRLPLIPRLIISVDRSGTYEQAEENINLAIEMVTQQSNHIGKYLVGVELGGNPTRNDFRTFEPLFQMARDRGLPVAIHCGEVPSSGTSSDSALKKAYDEAVSVIQFRPDRLGHALLLPDYLIDRLMQQPIPIECCPTSNVMTLQLALHHGGSLTDGMKRHPQLGKWLEKNYPISINTDDAGIFTTNLTKEYLLVAKAYRLGEAELAVIVQNSIDYIFDPTDETKLLLRKRIKERIDRLNCTL
ncbi:adenosine deaminase [Thalassiosira pseudonana CCMP1335]|uniref:Adenosine deaminase n=1 Tax=Thalassiosira pseudonana TaxID=35128 RepID=B8CD03_THAPS|nr:adenosine deaminase [Thalassiosira pseudonana CCMP1335]EED88522.1 adenosine deaminase [Thalassiosira pseudonana CCMP1335]